jgi:hypothetical protein
MYGVFNFKNYVITWCDKVGKISLNTFGLSDMTRTFHEGGGGNMAYGEFGMHELNR